MKLSLVTLYDCYGLVLKNPQIKSYFTRWLNHKKRAMCRIDPNCKQEMTEYNESMLSKINKL